MRILIEEHQYRAEAVKDVLDGIDALENVEGFVSLNYVGYFYNTRLEDCVFILPKVLLEDKDGKELVFGEHEPEDIINMDGDTPLTSKERDFIYEFSVWIYRAISVFRDSNPNSSIVYQKKVIEACKGRRKLTNTFLDILLALIQWNKDNQNFVFFTLRNLHSGFNKINWTRTIGTTAALVKNGTPIYLNPVNKRKQINFDEELLVIFYSILNYIGDHYGFAKNINANFTLITGKRFDMYLKNYGKTRLHQIKYKYFSDKALELWELCYAFFDSARQVYTSAQQKEYLLVKNFNIVFEAIIDELIGDKDIPAGLKEQADGKRVDHMYTYQGLAAPDEEYKPIYYIGDSKYYKRGTPIGRESVYKQFTYARNVIQWNLRLFLGDDEDDEADAKALKADRNNFMRVPMLRDEKTEGYNIIPNFFISARLNKELNYENNILPTDKQKTHFYNRHFKNRLFDRDTLLVCHYDVNFLYVLSLYARNNQMAKRKWKGEMRDKFRTKIQKFLNDHFTFYAMQALPGVDGGVYIREHFQDVLGKVFSPFDNKQVLSLALDNSSEFAKDNETLLSELRQHFDVKDCPLGTNPKYVFHDTPQTYNVVPQGKELVLVGYCKDERHLALIKKYGMYYVRAGLAKGSMRLIPGFEQSRYVLVHNTDFQELYELSETGPRIVMGEELREKGFDAGHDFYLAFDLADQKAIVNVHTKTGVFKIKKPKNPYSMEPYFKTLEELLEPERLFDDID